MEIGCPSEELHRVELDELVVPAHVRVVQQSGEIVIREREDHKDLSSMLRALIAWRNRT